MPARLGLYGGTFDPPHIGHLVVGVEVAWALGLDELLFVVANDPWQKSAQRPITDAAIRLRMTEAAVAPYEVLRASDLELRRGGPSYTIDTVEQLGGAGVETVVVVGSDAAASLPTWHRADELASLVEVAVVGRPGAATPDLGPEWAVRAVEVPSIDVSSSDIRARVREGRPIEALVPDAVRAEIEAHGLYRERR